MQAVDTPCSLEHAIDAPAIETPEALPRREEDAATQGDVRPAASGFINIKQEILQLADHGIYSLPVTISTDADGKKSTSCGAWKSFQTVEYWKAHIHDCLRSSKPNGLAILTGPRDLYCIDIDVASSRDERSGEKKRAGTELWDKLVAEHGEPATLKVATGSGGFHFYFSRSETVGSNWRNNFQGLVVGGSKYGVDGRGTGGLLFAPPSRFMGKQGERRPNLGPPRAMG
jgi:hypothetical protein